MICMESMIPTYDYIDEINIEYRKLYDHYEQNIPGCLGDGVVDKISTTI